MCPVLDSQTVQELVELLNQKDEAGKYRFAQSDVEHIIPLFFILGKDELANEALPLDLLRHLQRLARTVGITLQMTDSEIQRRVVVHYEEHPPHPELLRALQQFFREANLKNLGEGQTAALRKAMAMEGSIGRSKGLPTPQSHAGFEAGGHAKAPIKKK